jgi:hypothetical protein
LRWLFQSGDFKVRERSWSTCKGAREIVREREREIFVAFPEYGSIHVGQGGKVPSVPCFMLFRNMLDKEWLKSKYCSKMTDDHLHRIYQYLSLTFQLISDFCC